MDVMGSGRLSSQYGTLGPNIILVRTTAAGGMRRACEGAKKPRHLPLPWSTRGAVASAMVVVVQRAACGSGRKESVLPARSSYRRRRAPVAPVG